MAKIRERLQEILKQFDPAENGTRCIEAALFTTFNFDPNFFEENVLPVLFGASGMNPRAVRHQAVHEGLSKVPVGVCFDASVARPGVDDYRYTAFPIRLQGAFFHPKNIILIGQRAGKRWLYVSAASSNLTLSGWGLNIEGFADTWVHAKPQQPWQAVDEFLQWMLRRLRLSRQRHPITQIRDLMSSMPERRQAHALDPQGRDWRELDDQFLYFSTGHMGLATAVKQYYGEIFGNPTHICAASPYWSNVAENIRLFGAQSWEIIPALTQKRDRIGLTADEKEKLDQSVVLSRWKDEQDGRFRHAKILSIKYPRRVVVTGIGSCNFTNAGLSSKGNVESMLFSKINLELPSRINLKEQELADQAPLEEEVPKPPDWSVQVTYDWKTRLCRWRMDVGSPPLGARLEITGLGSYPLEVSQGRAEWTNGPQKDRGFRVVWNINGERHSWEGWLLEINLDQAPKIYGAPLDPSDILESWRNGGKHGPPVPRGSYGDESDEEDISVEAVQTTFNLFEFYRSVRELEDALLARKVSAQEWLVSNSNSVFALSAAIASGAEPIPVRYLVLKEAHRLFSLNLVGRERRYEHMRQVREWHKTERMEILAMLTQECPEQSAEELLDWMDVNLDAWEHRR